MKKIFSFFISGLLVQILVFSSGGWMTIPGNIILVLIWIKIESKFKCIKADFNVNG